MSATNTTIWYNGSNDVESCWKKSFGLDIYLPSYLPPLQVAIFSVYIVLGGLLNGCIVFLVAKYRTLHQTDFALTMQVVIANVLFVLCFPFAMGTLMGGSHLLVPAECYIMGFVKLTLNFVRFMMMLVISIDRFCLVFSPFSYPRYRTKACICLSFIAWASAFLASFIPLFMDCYGYLPTFGFCMVRTHCSIQCWVYTAGVICLMVFLGGILPSILYTLMFCKARKFAKMNNVSILLQNSAHGQVTFLLLLVTLLGFSAPLLVAIVFWKELSMQFGETMYWVYFGLSMTVFEAIVVADPIMIMRNRDVRTVTAASIKTMMGKRCCSKCRRQT